MGKTTKVAAKKKTLPEEVDELRRRIEELERRPPVSYPVYPWPVQPWPAPAIPYQPLQPWQPSIYPQITW